jgi:hypothetical protein
MPRGWQLSRRALLQALAGLVGVDAARAVDQRPDSSDGASTSAADAAAPRTTLALTAAELDDLVAFAGILLAEGPLAGEDRRHVIEHIEYRLASRTEYRELYGETVRGLERLAGARFARLTSSQQLDLVRRHGLAATSLVAPDRRPLDPPERIRARVVHDLIAGYYGSPAGWTAVGASAYPGRCGELEIYTRPEA